jgi:hypothetical protein
MLSVLSASCWPVLALGRESCLRTLSGSLRGGIIILALLSLVPSELSSDAALVRDLRARAGGRESHLRWLSLACSPRCAGPRPGERALLSVLLGEWLALILL